MSRFKFCCIDYMGEHISNALLILVSNEYDGFHV